MSMSTRYFNGMLHAGVDIQSVCWGQRGHCQNVSSAVLPRVKLREERAWESASRRARLESESRRVFPRTCEAKRRVSQPRGRGAETFARLCVARFQNQKN